MTPPFKPGDEVICTNAADSDGLLLQGGRYRIANCEPHGLQFVSLKGVSEIWLPQRFQPAEPAPLADDIAATAAMMRRTAERMIGDEDEGIILRGCRLTGFAMGVELWAKGLREQQ